MDWRKIKQQNNPRCNFGSHINIIQVSGQVYFFKIKQWTCALKYETDSMIIANIAKHWHLLQTLMLFNCQYVLYQNSKVQHLKLIRCLQKLKIISLKRRWINQEFAKTQFFRYFETKVLVEAQENVAIQLFILGISATQLNYIRQAGKTYATGSYMYK